ncbi:YdcF family protein [Roseicyclus sp.]|uniref:YdcF family protein n=1 Tax=Roseicyclus sp. TaxID=1914329 RepID=UPI003F9EC36B
MRVLRRLAFSGLVLWAATFLAVLAASAFWPRERVPERPADAIVCLGAGLVDDVSRLPDSASTRRAATCAALHAAGVAPLIVFTGYGNTVASAGDGMADVAREAGVTEAAILVDPHALSTIQNAANSLALLPQGTGRIVIVSDAFHLPRAWVIFRLMGPDEVAPVAAADPFPASSAPAGRSTLSWVLRESVAIWFNAARGVAYVAAGLAGVDHATRIGWFD